MPDIWFLERARISAAVRGAGVGVEVGVGRGVAVGSGVGVGEGVVVGLGVASGDGAIPVVGVAVAGSEGTDVAWNADTTAGVVGVTLGKGVKAVSGWVHPHKASNAPVARIADRILRLACAFILQILLPALYIGCPCHSGSRTVCVK